MGARPPGRPRHSPTAPVISDFGCDAERNILSKVTA